MEIELVESEKPIPVWKRSHCTVKVNTYDKHGEKVGSRTIWPPHKVEEAAE